MSHSYNKIWIHAIWSTKDRRPLIEKSAEAEIFNYIKKEFQEIGCQVKMVNGMPDHIHCLFLLSPQKSIAEIIKQIKGSSSHYINNHDLINDKFAWQTGYAAFSVSESAVEKVFLYIQNQTEHHRKKTFQEEYEDFLKLYKIEQQPEE